jgi:hypothetical protein
MVSPILDGGVDIGGWNKGLVSERYDISRALPALNLPQTYYNPLDWFQELCSVF